MGQSTTYQLFLRLKQHYKYHSYSQRMILWQISLTIHQQQVLPENSRMHYLLHPRKRAFQIRSKWGTYDKHLNHQIPGYKPEHCQYLPGISLLFHKDLRNPSDQWVDILQLQRLCCKSKQYLPEIRGVPKSYLTIEHQQQLPAHNWLPKMLRRHLSH